MTAEERGIAGRKSHLSAASGGVGVPRVGRRQEGNLCALPAVLGGRHRAGEGTSSSA